MLGEVAVDRQAVGTVVVLGNCEGDPLGDRWTNPPARQRSRKPEVTLEHGRPGHRLHHVRNDAETGADTV
jgi:hypothetical protein